MNTEPLLGFNLGTGTPDSAVQYVEYCNLAKGTKWSDLRREHVTRSRIASSIGAWATRWTDLGRWAT